MLKKYMLYITGFFCGMSVMAVELGASRLLAPYFSSSQIVWTIIIGTIMIAMAIGNVIGGKMADKHSTPDKLFAFVFAAACWIALIPLFGKFVVAGIALLLATFVTSNYLVWAALFSCLAVFVFPLLVLGMVTPNLVKFAVDDLEENGKVVGTIEALNTIGSIIGTFLPTFVTIPFVGTSWTFIIFALILFAICITYFFVRKKGRIKFSVACALILALGISGSGIGVAFWDGDVLYEGESLYNYLRVEEDEDSYILSTNVVFGVQSIKMKEDGLTGLYYDYALAANAISTPKSDTPEILILGLGTGTFAYQTQLYFGDINVDGVEIDEKIVYLARKYFSLPDCVNVHVTDGRAFLDSTDKKYDVIMVDAYQDITIPFQMSSIEFFSKVKEHLNSEGVMVVNMNMYSFNEGGINDYLCGTIKRVFDNAYGVKTDVGNYELFASNGYDCKQKLGERLNKYSGELKTMLNKVYDRLEIVEDNPYVLTDDKAPVELLGMSVLDDMIFNELDYYRGLIKGKSLKELIEMLKNGELF